VSKKTTPLEKLASNILAKIQKRVKNEVTFTTADGVVIKFADLEEGQEPVEGDKATWSGDENLDGDVTMSDGVIWHFENGVFINYVRAEGGDEGSDELINPHTGEEVPTDVVELQELVMEQGAELVEMEQELIEASAVIARYQKEVKARSNGAPTTTKSPNNRSHVPNTNRTSGARKK